MLLLRNIRNIFLKSPVVLGKHVEFLPYTDVKLFCSSRKLRQFISLLLFTVLSLTWVVTIIGLSFGTLLYQLFTLVSHQFSICGHRLSGKVYTKAISSFLYASCGYVSTVSSLHKNLLNWGTSSVPHNPLLKSLIISCFFAGQIRALSFVKVSVHTSVMVGI